MTSHTEQAEKMSAQDKLWHFAFLVTTNQCVCVCAWLGYYLYVHQSHSCPRTACSLSACVTLEQWSDGAHQNSYTLSHPENDRDAWRYWARTRIHAAKRILYASIPVFLIECVRKHTIVARAMTSVFLRNARWRHGRSRGETKYSYVVCPLNGINYNGWK